MGPNLRLIHNDNGLEDASKDMEYGETRRCYKLIFPKVPFTPPRPMRVHGYVIHLVSSRAQSLAWSFPEVGNAFDARFRWWSRT